MGTSEQFTILQLVFIDETGDSYYRMRWPAAELARQDCNLRVINLDARAVERFDWALACDLLVVYQSHDNDLLPIIAARKSKGLKTLVEYNDNFYAPPAWSPVARDWASPILWQSYERFMEQGDKIIVTGPGLQQLFSTKFPLEKISILENDYPFTLEGFDSLWDENSKELRLGWAGSQGHMADFLAVVPTIRKLLDTFPEITFHVMGNAAIPELVNLPSNRFKYTPWGTMQQYLDFLRGLHLGVAPILDTPYNMCRSDVKAIELSARGALPIVAMALPYQKFLAKTNIAGFTTQAELFQSVSEYARDRQKLKADAKKCYDYVQAERCGPKRVDRLELYRSFLPRVSQNQTKVAWPVGMGYHEIQGTPQVTNPSHDLLVAAQNLIREKRAREALEKLSIASKASPLNPDLSYAELKCLRAIDRTAFRKRLSEALALFPGDLRFDLISLSLCSDPTEVVAAWQALIAKCEVYDRIGLSFYASEIARAFSSVLRALPTLLQLAERVVALISENAELRLAMAETYEKRLMFREALQHFNWLERAKATADMNREFFSTLQPGYLKAWQTTLEARIKDQP